MKPITDDMVFSLLRGLEEREKDALAERARDLTPGNCNDVAARSRTAAGETGQGSVVSLQAARETRRERETVRGMFCYAARL